MHARSSSLQVLTTPSPSRRLARRELEWGIQVAVHTRLNFRRHLCRRGCVARLRVGLGLGVPLTGRRKADDVRPCTVATVAVTSESHRTEYRSAWPAASACIRLGLCRMVLVRPLGSAATEPPGVHGPDFGTASDQSRIDALLSDGRYLILEAQMHVPVRLSRRSAHGSVLVRA